MIKENAKGFTVVELMMSMAASSAVIAALFLAIRVESEHMDTSNLKMVMETSAREGLYRMIQEIRLSSPTRITISNSNQTITFTVPNPSSPVSSSYAVNWAGGQSIRYDLTSGQIIRTNTSTNSTSVLANDVTALSFTGNSASPTVVTVSMSVQKSLSNGRTVPATALQFAGKARIRNSG